MPLVLELAALVIGAFYFYLCSYRVVSGGLIRLDGWLFERSVSSPRWRRVLQHGPSFLRLSSWWMRPFYMYCRVRTRLIPQEQLHAQIFVRYFGEDPRTYGGPAMQCLVSCDLAILANRIDAATNDHAALWNQCHATTEINTYIKSWKDLERAASERRLLLIDFGHASKAARYFNYAILPEWKDYRTPGLYPNISE